MKISQFASRLKESVREYINPQGTSAPVKKGRLGKELLASIRATLIHESDGFAEYIIPKIHILSTVSVSGNTISSNAHLAGFKANYTQEELNAEFARAIDSMGLHNIKTSQNFQMHLNPVQNGLVSFMDNAEPFEVALSYSKKEQQSLPYPLKIEVLRETGISEHIITSLPCLVGRSGASNVPIIGTDVVSRKHFVITMGRSNGLIIKDESRNGTFIGGRDLHGMVHQLLPNASIALDLGFGRVGGEVTEEDILLNMNSGNRRRFPRITITYGNFQQPHFVNDEFVNEDSTPNPRVRQNSAVGARSDLNSADPQVAPPPRGVRL